MQRLEVRRVVVAQGTERLSQFVFRRLHCGGTRSPMFVQLPIMLPTKTADVVSQLGLQVCMRKLETVSSLFVFLLVFRLQTLHVVLKSPLEFQNRVPDIAMILVPAGRQSQEVISQLDFTLLLRDIESAVTFLQLLPVLLRVALEIILQSRLDTVQPGFVQLLDLLLAPLSIAGHLTKLVLQSCSKTVEIRLVRAAGPIVLRVVFLRHPCQFLHDLHLQRFGARLQLGGVVPVLRVVHLRLLPELITQPALQRIVAIRCGSAMLFQLGVLLCTHLRHFLQEACLEGFDGRLELRGMLPVLRVLIPAHVPHFLPQLQLQGFHCAMHTLVKSVVLRISITRKTANFLQQLGIQTLGTHLQAVSEISTLRVQIPCQLCKLLPKLRARSVHQSEERLAHLCGF
mmetsp:Transcript_14709/g.40422  ORF Transcript_14709/g.40422 Transcript_14709/m.40422 type:complete len:399 (+) Transcript_14709:4280-5476(+)